VAVDDVSFAVGKGEVVGFLGPNGAGKSTTLRILAGFLGPSAGTVRIAGHDIVDAPLEARLCIGYMPEAVPLYPEMRVVEYLRFRAELKRVSRPMRAQHVDEAIHKAGIAEVANKRIAHLSRGYRQRVGLADALVSRPPIVILDEPTAGLDPNQIRETRALVRELGCEHTVVLSTHILTEVESCATRVLLIHRGKLVAQGTTAELRAMRSSTGVQIVVRGDADTAERALRSVGAVSTTSRIEGEEGARLLSGSGERAIVVLATFAKKVPRGDRDRAIEECVAALVAAGLGVREVHARGGSLEEVFAALTRDQRQETGDGSMAEETETGG
jgi:gliding motility-associated transport system ATP-binding protein